jgi:hypothetical protein
VFGEAAQVLLRGAIGLVPAAEGVLGRDQVQNDFRVAAQFRVALEVGLDPGRFAGLEAGLEVAVD